MALTTYTQDNLEVSPELLKTVTVKNGTSLARGDLVKLTGLFTAGAGVAGVNTGNATMGTPTAQDTAAIGTFTVIFTAATVFHVINPSGVRLKDGATGVAYLDQVGFTITAGATPMVAGDTFTIPVTLATTPVVELFTTGSDPYTVMFDTIDATAGAKSGRAYREAELLASEVNFGTGTLAEVRDALDKRDIHLV